MWAFSRARGAIGVAVLALALAGVTALAQPAAAKTKRAAPKFIATPQFMSRSPISTPNEQAPARFFTINSVLAKLEGRTPGGPARLASVPLRGAISDAPVAAPVPPRGEEPFGLFAFRAPEGLLWVKQRRLAGEVATEAELIERCRAEPATCYDIAALRFIVLIDAARRLDGRARLDAVNHAVNTALAYTSDFAQHGVADLWLPPLASLASGRGDCEDYAIAKYVALREAGMAPDDLRILLVRDRAIGQDHAVLAARDDGRWFILDNRWTSPRADADIRNFVPLFAIDHRGVNLFAAPYARNTADGAATTPSAADWGEAAAGALALRPALM